MKNYRNIRDKHPSKERMYELIRKPIITEKSTLITEFNQVTFSIPVDASKFEIKSAVEHLFDVKVLSVNTIRQKGKTKRFKGFLGQRNGRKKAIVTLNEGDAIDVSASI